MTQTTDAFALSGKFFRHGKELALAISHEGSPTHTPSPFSVSDADGAEKIESEN